MGSITFIYSDCNNEELKPDGFSIIIDKSNPLPYELINLTIKGQTFSLDKYDCKIGDVSIKALKTSKDSLLLMVPYLPANNYKLTLDIEGKKGSTDIIIKEQTFISNQEQLINEVISGANNIIPRLESIAISNGQTLSTDDKKLITNMTSSFNDVYAQLTTNDKNQFAQFITNHPEIFSSFNFKADHLDNQLYVFKNYISMQIFPIAVSSGAFYLTLGLPDLISKLICISSGLYLVSKLFELKLHVNQFYNETVVPTASEIESSNKTSGFSFFNNKAVILNINVNYRTVYNADNNTSIPELRTIVG
jgi:hypothetical protein